MELKLSGRHIDLTPAMRDYAESKVGKLPRYYDRITSIEVVVDREDHPEHYGLEVIVQVEKADPFVVRVTGEDVYACVDESVDKLERILTDHKEKLRNRKHPKQ